MSISFYCPCGQKLPAGEEQAGKRVRCPSCKRILAAPIPLLNHTELNEPPEDEAETRKIPTVPEG